MAYHLLPLLPPVYIAPLRLLIPTTILARRMVNQIQKRVSYNISYTAIDHTRLARRYNMATVHMFVLFNPAKRNSGAYLLVNQNLMILLDDLLS